MKTINLMLQKCKTLSTQIVKTSSYTGQRSKSSTANGHQCRSAEAGGKQHQRTLFVGSTRKQYVIDSKYLKHPLVKALIGKSGSVEGDNAVSVISCEVVLFDHLLWMLDDQNFDWNLSLDSLDELADFYYVN